MNRAERTDRAAAGEASRQESERPFEVPHSAVDEGRLFQHLSGVFAASVGMIGVCTTTIGIVRLVESTANYTTLTDELLVVDSLCFLVSAIVSFVAIRRRTRHRPIRLADSVDVIFFIGLVVMVLICGLFAWSIA